MDAPNRSWLFIPGLEPRMIEKAVRAGADAVIIDLEDAVAPDLKATARGVVAEWLGTAPSEGPEVWVRVNQRDGVVDAEDVAAVVGPTLRGLVVPKAEDPAQLEALARSLAPLEADRGVPTGAIRIAPLIETPRGVEAAAALARSAPGRVLTLILGAVDYLAQLGVEGRTDGPAAMHALARLAVAAAAAGLAPAVDSAYVDVADEEGLTAATLAGRELGCFGKLVIHPRQLAAVHRALTPTTEQISRATRVVEAFAQAMAEGRAALLLDGRLIDPPVVAMAHRMLALARRTDAAG